MRALRLHHRRGHGAHALRRQAPADPRRMAMAAEAARGRRDHRRCSGMAWGFNPYLTEAEPLPRRLPGRGRESIAKLVCRRFRSHEDMYLTFQEYFEQHAATSPSAGASRWPPCWARCMAQMDLGIASIGGKDSMSGSFEAAGRAAHAGQLCHRHRQDSTMCSRPEFKSAGQRRGLAASPSMTPTACPRSAS